MRSTTIKMFIVFAFVLTVAVNSAQGQGSHNCTPSTSTKNRTYYTSCYPRWTGEATDQMRIQRAVDNMPSGKLIFDEGLYEVSDTIILKSYLILEGVTTNTLAEASYPTGSHIKMTGTDKAIFDMGGTAPTAVHDVVIRDIGLSATSRTGTIGILGEGSKATDAASLNFEFNNVRFTGFQYGIKVQALDSGSEYQFDNVKVEHCSFEGNSTGIYINSYNSGWQIHSLEFNLLANQVGIDIVRNSYSDIDSLIGNGQAGTPAYALIRIKEHTNLRISNSVSEGVQYDLKIEGLINGLNFPIHLDNNTFQDNVDISKATIYATSNQYGVNGGSGPTPKPIARDSSQIYSHGEKFCYEGSSTCATSGWIFQTSANMVSSSDQNRNYWSRPSLFENTISVNTDDGSNSASNPLVSIIAPTYANKALLRLGQTSFYYTLFRNNNNGWLEFNGNQSAPYTGYSFNGPVKLPSFTQATLPPVLENGSMVYCPDCQASSSPCAGVGSGALAISISSQWVCK